MPGVVAPPDIRLSPSFSDHLIHCVLETHLAAVKLAPGCLAPNPALEIVAKRPQLDRLLTAKRVSGWCYRVRESALWLHTFRSAVVGGAAADSLCRGGLYRTLSTCGQFMLRSHIVTDVATLQCCLLASLRLLSSVDTTQTSPRMRIADAGTQPSTTAKAHSFTFRAHHCGGLGRLGARLAVGRIVDPACVMSHGLHGLHSPCLLAVNGLCQASFQHRPGILLPP